ncbi:613_t:CDS:2 [Acaulospora morrowiae]|uniref:613_t:CDS:1 n=1 Tax=Acaulospora morrowiae TaxID=94023 RepID=A0A9N9DDV5_9GLOM|nr:613_t:CDS:2 [Acaulospora morrowiae]
MTEFDENDPLQLLKQYDNKDLIPQLLDADGNVVHTLKETKYIQFDSKKFDKDMITNFRSAATNELLPLSVLYHATITKKLDLVHYNENATNEKFSTRLGFVDRRNWLDFIKGKGSYVRLSEKRPLDAADSEQQLAAERKRQRKAEYEKDKIWREVYRKTRELSPKSLWEESFESKAKEENYTYYIQLADDYFLKMKKDSASQDRGAHSRQDPVSRTHHRSSGKSRAPKVPLILVTSAPSAFITMYNVKQLLQDQRYEDQVKLRNEKPKERLIQITHKGRVYEFTDTTDNLQEADWDRVVCIITDGSEWIFKKYKWKTPQDTFKHVPGVYFKFYGDDVKKNVKTWRNVQGIDIHREFRHRDPEAFMEFWKLVERSRL